MKGGKTTKSTNVTKGRRRFHARDAKGARGECAGYKC